MTKLAYKILSKMEKINYEIEFGRVYVKKWFKPKTSYTLKDFLSYIPLVLLNYFVYLSIIIVKGLRKLYRIIFKTEIIKE